MPGSRNQESQNNGQDTSSGDNATNSLELPPMALLRKTRSETNNKVLDQDEKSILPVITEECIIETNEGCDTGICSFDLCPFQSISCCSAVVGKFKGCGVQLCNNHRKIIYEAQNGFSNQSSVVIPMTNNESSPDIEQGTTAIHNQAIRYESCEKCFDQMAKEVEISDMKQGCLIYIVITIMVFVFSGVIILFIPPVNPHAQAYNGVHNATL